MSTTYIFGSTNQSREIAYDGAAAAAKTTTATCNPVIPSSFPPIISEVICSHLTWSTLWFSVLCLFIVLNAKHMPFMWHVSLNQTKPKKTPPPINYEIGLKKR